MSGRRERTTAAVVGGGITGLAAALRLSERGPTLLLEASPDHLGGQIRTHHTSDGVFEGGPDTFLTAKPGAVELCEKLGLSSRIVRLAPPGAATTILREGSFLPIPEGLSMLAPTRAGPLLRSPLFSPGGKLRILAEPLIPTRSPGAGDESLAAFVRRRFGAEALERLAEPVLGSLFTADAEQLSLETVMPRFVELERQYGSLTRAARSLVSARAEGRGHAAAAPAAALEGGLETLVRAMAERLPPGAVRMGSRLEGIERRPGGLGWRLRLRDATLIDADAIVLAAPAPVVGDSLEELDPTLADELRALRYAPCATINLLYDAADGTRVPPGHGCFIPRTEGSPLLAVSFVSRKLPGRVAEGHLLLRAFVGGALHPEIVDCEEDDLCAWTEARLASLFELPPRALVSRATKFQRAMPQYEVGFGSRLAKIQDRLGSLPGIAVAGSAVGAVGLPDCIRSGERAADAVLTHLREAPNRSALRSVAS